MKKLQNRWIAVYAGEGFIGLLQEAVMYAWLLYAVLNKGMSIADFTLYIGSIRSFNAAMGKLLERWTHMVRDSRLICDYRDFLEYPEKAGERFGKNSFRKDYRKFLGKEGKTLRPFRFGRMGSMSFNLKMYPFLIREVRRML